MPPFTGSRSAHVSDRRVWRIRYRIHRPGSSALTRRCLRGCNALPATPAPEAMMRSRSLIEGATEAPTATAQDVGVAHRPHEYRRRAVCLSAQYARGADPLLLQAEVSPGPFALFHPEPGSPFGESQHP